MLMYEPAHFIKSFVTDLDAALEKRKSNARLTHLQKTWLGFCLTGMLLTNSVCWAKFERASLGEHKIAALSWMFLVVQAIQFGMSPEQAKKQAHDQLHDGTKQLINMILSAYSGLAANTTQLMKETIERKQVEQRLNTSATKLKLTVQRLEMANEDLKNNLLTPLRCSPRLLKCAQALKVESQNISLKKPC